MSPPAPCPLPCARLQTKMLAVYGEKDPNLDDAQRLVNMFITGHKVGIKAWRDSSSSSSSSSSWLQPTAGAAYVHELQRTDGMSAAVKINDVTSEDQRCYQGHDPLLPAMHL
jgi:hypothetical protein